MRRLLAIAMLLALAGPARAAWAPLRYLEARGRDFLDAFELNAGVGPGAKLSVNYGLEFFGAADVKSWRLGTFGGHAGTWRELDTTFGILPLSLLAWPVAYGADAAGWRGLAGGARFVAEDGSKGFEHLDRKELNGDPAFLLKDTADGPIHTRWGDSFPIGGEIHAGVGIRAFLRPLQLVDFLVGFVGIDLDPWLATNPEQ